MQCLKKLINQNQLQENNMARVEGNEGLAKEFVGGATIAELAEKYDLPEMRIAIKLGSIHIAKLSDEKKAELANVKADVKKYSKADVEAAKAKAKEEARAEFAAELDKGEVSARDTNETGEGEGEGGSGGGEGEGEK